MSDSSTIQYFRYENRFELESGHFLPRLTLGYHTFGRANHDCSNVVWIIHALTADSQPTKWWQGVVGPGMAIDTDRYFVVCANTLGSHYGSTSPLSLDPINCKPYYHDFPSITNRDIVQAFKLLADHLRIRKINTLIGPSIGGQQALEWAVMYPQMIEKLVAIATNAVHSPYGVAFNESQRMAIELDPSWEQASNESGLEGLKVARSIALLSYRTKLGYDSTQTRTKDAVDKFAAASYQQYQGEKLSRRFNAYSYYLLTKAMDSHDLGRARESVQYALSTITADTTVISISSDILFPPKEQQLLASYIPKVNLINVESHFGHDGFLVEAESISQAFSQVFQTDSAIV